MSTTTATPISLAPDTRTAPTAGRPGGPVFIGDAVTPLAGTTLLALTWPKGPNDR
ncbi:hypothetical protein ILP92_02695 [Maribius pontilimi]|uniref:Uncharacterized protein n=1 Tax=Palleronia pontilimi TaxID=1964209 RepID=A0A934MFP8_9RHOB|nr:hypothetical protein [Palleronia pontilimi]MBJ3761659.1 hypothetical protein [Palleronia pontilimi]